MIGLRDFCVKMFYEKKFFFNNYNSEVESYNYDLQNFYTDADNYVRELQNYLLTAQAFVECEIDILNQQ